MGFNLKEKLQNVSKKNVAIFTIVLLLLTICAMNTITTNNLKHKNKKCLKN